VTRNGHRTPTIIVVKCGMPSEARDKKPGNRGKRDSQLILMNFFSRVTYNDRMSPLDFDIFRKVHVLMGVTPDFFEVVLMVSLPAAACRRFSSWQGWGSELSTALQARPRRAATGDLQGRE
jgi:hypothetical protein